MRSKYLVGVDLGTSGTKSALYQVDGTKIAEASAEVALHHPKPGIVEQDNADFYDSAAVTVKKCIDQSGVNAQDIAAIAFDSQMAGVGLIDEDFQPIAHFDSWLDMRCKPYIELMDSEAGELVTKLTGCPPTCDHGPKMLWWKHEQPDIYNKTAKFIMPGTYVAGRMGGLKSEQAFIDYTYLHFSGFSDALNSKWSEQLCNQFDLDMNKLPEIVEPWRVIGEVKEQASRDFGLRAGTLIAAGAGDTAANALGAGIVEPGLIFDVAGTASVLASCTDSYVADTKNRALLTMHSVIPGLWNPLAYIGGGGLALRWFRDQFYDTFHGRNHSTQTDMYAEMIDLASKIPPGSEGLLFSPHLGGRICPSGPEMRGAWIGVSWSHTQAHFARAILESIAFEYAYYLQILRELLPTLDLVQARVIGGGARSQAWNQIKANVLGIPYQRLKGNEFGTWGAAMIAGKAAGLINDLATHASETTHITEDVILPDEQTLSDYKPIIERYIQMQETMSRFFAGGH
ncbi:MAG: FGGY family carbohydrate kinase [Anaerolineaceae bacterium]|nr:FGGY family carbohydrate kinase [Anaerolineaceae bacterium]